MSARVSLPFARSIAGFKVGFSGRASALALSLAVGTLGACQQQNNKPLRVGYQNSPAMALIMIADERKFFDAHHVRVDLKEFTAGKFALQAFLGGSLDVAVAGDVPTGLALLQGQHFVAVGEVLKGSHGAIRMVIRQKGGCQDVTPEKYFWDKHRSIATSFGGGPQYFTARFLNAHNIPLSQVKIISQAPENMVSAVTSGTVDGIAIFDPAAAKAEALLGVDHCTFPDPGVYREHYVIVTRPDELKPKPDARLRDFMAALRDAERFAAEHPLDAQKIVSQKTKIPADKVQQMWPEFEFGVALDPDLAKLWMAEADWHRSQPGAGAGLTQPDYAAATDRTLIENR